MPKTLGEHLRKRRHELGLHQKDVAKQLGVAHETYANREKGHTRPYTPSWGRVIAFLGYDPSPAARTFGERIAAKRRELGLTQAKLAALLGWDEATLFRYERGRWMPKGKRLQQLEKFLESGPLGQDFMRP